MQLQEYVCDGTHIFKFECSPVIILKKKKIKVGLVLILQSALSHRVEKVEKSNYSMTQKAITVFKSSHGLTPEYLRALFINHCEITENSERLRKQTCSYVASHQLSEKQF